MAEMFTSPLPGAAQARERAWEIALASGTAVLALAGEVAADDLCAGDRVIARSGAVRLAACRAERLRDAEGRDTRLIRLRFDRPVTLLTMTGDVAAIPVQNPARR